jgi:AsmA family protein
MKIIVGIISVILLLILAVPVLGYVALQNVGTEKLKPIIANAVMERTGRTLTIAGAIESEFSFTPTVTASNISLSNPEWVKEGDMVQVDSAQVSLDLRSLLQKKIVINAVTVTGADVVLAKEKTRNSWTFDPMNKQKLQEEASTPDMKAMKKSLLDVQIGAITFENSTVTFLDNGKSFAASLPVINATLQPAISVKGTAVYQGSSTEFSLKPKAADLSELIDKAVAVVLTTALKDGYGTITATGDVTNIADDIAFDGKVTGKIASLHHLNTLIPNGSLSPSDPITLDTNIRATATQLNVVMNDVRYGATTVRGKADVKLAKAIPYVTANITIPSYALSPSAPAPSAKSSASAPAAKSASSNIDVSALHKFNGSLSLVVDALQQDGKTLAKNITAKATVKDKRLSITNYSAGIYGGQATGSATVNAANKTPDISFKTVLTGFTASGLLSQFTQYRNVSNGSLNADIALASSGATTDALMQNAHGTIAYTLGKTLVDVPASATQINAFLNILRGKNTEGKQVEVTCSVGKLSVSNGVARTNTLLVDTPGAVISAEGTVNIANNTVAMTLSPRSKLAGLSSIAIPVKVSGAFSDLTFRPEAKATLGALGSIGLSLIKDKTGISQLVGTALAENMKSANLPASCLKQLPQDAGVSLTTKEGLQKLEDDVKLQSKNIEKNVRAVRDNYKQQGKDIEKDVRAIRDNLKGLKDLF